MSKTLFRTIGLAVVCLVSCVFVWAHHGDAGRYNEDVMVITGTLVEVQMVNPHSLITFDVAGPTGQPVRWQAELGAAQQLMKQFGYKPLTNDIKRQIFGLNAARVYGVDPKARRNPVPHDYIDKLKDLYKQAGKPTPSNTQYGWVTA